MDSAEYLGGQECLCDLGHVDWQCDKGLPQHLSQMAGLLGAWIVVSLTGFLASAGSLSKMSLGAWTRHVSWKSCGQEDCLELHLG